MGKITVNRGTTYGITGTYKENGAVADITGSTIRFTVKSAEWDTDANDSGALIRKTGTVVSGPAGTYSITLTDTDTYVAPGNHFYDIKIELASGNIYKLDEGRFKVDGSPTNRTA